jgi:hypothetical protein
LALDAVKPTTLAVRWPRYSLSCHSISLISPPLP